MVLSQFHGDNLMKHLPRRIFRAGGAGKVYDFNAIVEYSWFAIVVYLP
jgi:hypothetical protein